MPPLLRHHRLVLLLVGMVALTRSTHGFVLVPSSSRSSFSDGRLAPSQASSTPSEGQASAPAPLTAEEGAKRRAALKGALLQSLVRSSAGAANELQGEDPVIACPVTLQPLTPEVRLAGPFGEVRSLVTTDGRYRYPQTPVFLDLVPAEDRSVELGSISIKPAQDLFRSPLTSFLYERGWRDNFKLSGFPGIDAEFTDLMAFLQPVQPASATVLDLSCGSGLMTRRLVQKGGWARVIAADYSESMLRETKGRFLRERIAVPTLVRADVARLPFRTGSLDAVHAGAALHCWPRLEEGLREVHRVLKPGGRFYASTFEVNARMRSDTFRFFQLEELTGLLKKTGFGTVEVRREGVACLIAQCVKGQEEGEEPAASSSLSGDGVVAGEGGGAIR